MSAALENPLPWVLVTYPPGTLHVGFTGTRKPLTFSQAQALLRQCVSIAAEQARIQVMPIVAHHGCCTGGDATFHFIARTLRWQRHGHPGVNDRGEAPFRALSVRTSLDYCEPELLYAVRNRNILSWSHILLACPLLPEDDPKSTRSGTWQTVRMARSQLVPVTVIMPDGSITKENS